MNKKQQEQLLKVLDYAIELAEDAQISILLNNTDIEDNNTTQILMMQNLKDVVKELPLEAETDDERQQLIKYCMRMDRNGCYSDEDSLYEMHRLSTLEEMRNCARDLGYYEDNENEDAEREYNRQLETFSAYQLTPYDDFE